MHWCKPKALVKCSLVLRWSQVCVKIGIRRQHWLLRIYLRIRFLIPRMRVRRHLRVHDRLRVRLLLRVMSCSHRKFRCWRTIRQLCLHALRGRVQLHESGAAAAVRISSGEGTSTVGKRWQMPCGCVGERPMVRLYTCSNRLAPSAAREFHAPVPAVLKTHRHRPGRGARND
eukprot:SAG31_NODE_3681_length_3992_cov_89.507835_4_plen_172_part_00